MAELFRDLHEPVQLVDGHAEHRGLLHRHAREEGPLSHQHAQFADEVALLDDEHHPVVPAVDEQYAAGEDEVQVIRVAGVHSTSPGPGCSTSPADRSRLRACSLSTGQACAPTSPGRRDE